MGQEGVGEAAAAKAKITRLLLFGVGGWEYMLDTHNAAFALLFLRS